MILYESFNEIHSICREYEIDDYTINSDGSIDVDGNVDLDHESITKLPLKFNKVKGYFECNNNKLTTLEGSPKEVGRYFSCLSNKLTSLKGGPKSVGEYYDCNANRLTSLEFMADEIGESLFCAQNNLTTLKGCPENIDGEFDCSGNLNLSDLKDFDSKFSGHFLCMNTNLHFLDKQEYNCISMFRRLNIIDGDTINKKRLMYLHSIFNFKFFKMDDISKNYDVI